DVRHVVKLSTNWQPSSKTDLRFRADYVHQTTDRPISNISVTPEIEAAFPQRFARDDTGQLVAVDLRPVNFDSARRDTLRVGFDFSKPLTARRPSQAGIAQIPQQFGFGGRGARRAAGAARWSRLAAATTFIPRLPALSICACSPNPATFRKSRSSTNGCAAPSSGSR